MSEADLQATSVFRENQTVTIKNNVILEYFLHCLHCKLIAHKTKSAKLAYAGRSSN
jgi:hypothetical protein